MSERIFNTPANMTPRKEQVTIDVYKGIGNPGERGTRQPQTDISVPNSTTNLRNADRK